MIIGLLILADLLNELASNPPHHRDDRLPCFTCGAEWDTFTIQHDDECAFMLIEEGLI